MQFVDLYAQYLTIKDEIDTAIESTIKNSSFIRGSAVTDFEDGFADLIGTKHCVSCANGTDAIYIVMKALGIQAGDEVITTAHSWISTSETITQAGGKVVFVDTEEDYFTIDPAQIESKITDKTKGIIPVHLYGQPADMDPILDIAKRHNLWVIEDCAQAHLATYKGRKVGTMGDAATFSFYPGKNLGAMGDAGGIVTNRDDIAEFSTLFARHGGKNNHVMEGINSRLDGLQAAILNVKLNHIENWTKLRQQHGAHYDQILADVSGITLPKVRPECEHVYHLYVVRSDRRDELRSHLKSNEIPTVVNYPMPLPLYKAYEHLEHKREEFSISAKHADQILSIPIYPEMPPEDRVRVADTIQGSMA